MRNSMNKYILVFLAGFALMSAQKASAVLYVNSETFGHDATIEFNGNRVKTFGLPKGDSDTRGPDGVKKVQVSYYIHPRDAQGRLLNARYEWYELMWDWSAYKKWSDQFKNNPAKYKYSRPKGFPGTVQKVILGPQITLEGPGYSIKADWTSSRRLN